MIVPLAAIAATLLVCRHDNPAKVGGLGLISVVPWPVFLIGAVLSVSFVMVLRRPEPEPLLLVIHVCAMTFLVHGVAALLEVEPRFEVAYLHVGITQVIINHQHPLTALDSRFSWPGFFTAAAAVVGMAHLGSALPLIRWTPLALNLSYLLPTYVIARTLLGSERRAWIVVWLFPLTNWVGQDYFSPQGVGYLLFLGILAVILAAFPSVGWRFERRRLGRLYQRLIDDSVARAPAWTSGQQFGLLMLLTASAIALAMEHQLTPVVLAVDICVLAAARVTSARYFAVLCVMATIGWISYGAIGFWSGHLSLLFGSGGSSAVSANVSGHFTGSSSHRFVLDERVGFSLVVWLAAAAGALRAVLGHRRLSLSTVILAVVPFPILLAQAYGGEATLRLYLFTLPFMLILLVGEFPRVIEAMAMPKALALAAISTALVPALLIACYGNEEFEQATPSDVHAAQYLYTVARPGSTLGLVVNNAFLSYTRLAQYSYVALDSQVTRYSLDTPTRLLNAIGGNSRGSYLLITPAQRNYAITTYGFPTDWVTKLTAQLARNSHFRLTYDRAGSFIYRVVGGPTKPVQPGGAGG